MDTLITTPVQTTDNTASSTQNLTNSVCFTAAWYLGMSYPAIYVIIGVPLNILNILRVRKRKTAASSYYIYVTALSVVDNIVLIHRAAMSYTPELRNKLGLDNTRLECAWTQFTLYTSTELSSWILVFLCIERTLVIYNPFYRQTSVSSKRARFLTAFAAAIFIAVNFIILFAAYQVHNRSNTCAFKDDYFDLIQKYWFKLHPILYAFIPFLLLLICNLFMCFTLCNSSESQRIVRRSSSNRRKQNSPVYTTYETIEHSDDKAKNMIDLSVFDSLSYQPEYKNTRHGIHASTNEIHEWCTCYSCQTTCANSKENTNTDESKSLLNLLPDDQTRKGTMSTYWDILSPFKTNTRGKYQTAPKTEGLKNNREELTIPSFDIKTYPVIEYQRSFDLLNRSVSCNDENLINTNSKSSVDSSTPIHCCSGRDEASIVIAIDQSNISKNKKETSLICSSALSRHFQVISSCIGRKRKADTSTIGRSHDKTVDKNTAHKTFHNKLSGQRRSVKKRKKTFLSGEKQRRKIMRSAFIASMIFLITTSLFSALSVLVEYEIFDFDFDCNQVLFTLSFALCDLNHVANFFIYSMRVNLKHMRSSIKQCFVKITKDNNSSPSNTKTSMGQRSDGTFSGFINKQSSARSSHFHHSPN